jgi:acyl-CoA thioester hydrolase
MNSTSSIESKEPVVSEKTSADMKPAFYTMEFRVDYADTDAMGIVHHASYLLYLERARVSWLRDIGMPYGELEKQGLALPVRAAEITYFKPLRFDDLAVVAMTVTTKGRTQLEIHYDVMLNGVKVSEAWTHHVVCKARLDGNGQKEWIPTRIPDQWRINGSR